jgi:hypothetical protein
LAYYIKVASIFIVHPADADACNNILAPENDDENVTLDVEPISVVAKSVNVIEPLVHTVITSPALAFDPLNTVYLPKAELYELVVWVNKVFIPAEVIDEVKIVNVDCIAKDPVITVLPFKVLDPLTNQLPVTVLSPIIVLEPLMNTLPVIVFVPTRVWFPISELEPLILKLPVTV